MSIIRPTNTAKLPFHFHENVAPSKLSEQDLQDIKNASTTYLTNTKYEEYKGGNFPAKISPEESKFAERENANSVASEEAGITMQEKVKNLAPLSVEADASQKKTSISAERSYSSALDSMTSVDAYDKKEKTSFLNTAADFNLVEKNNEYHHLEGSHEKDKTLSFYTEKEDDSFVTFKQNLTPVETNKDSYLSPVDQSHEKDLNSVENSDEKNVVQVDENYKHLIHPGRVDLVMGGTALLPQTIKPVSHEDTDGSLNSLFGSQAVTSTVSDVLPFAFSSEGLMEGTPPVIQEGTLFQQDIVALIDKSNTAKTSRALGDELSLFEGNEKQSLKKSDLITGAVITSQMAGEAPVASPQSASSGTLNTTTSVPPAVAMAVRSSHLIDELTAAVTQLRRNNSVGNDITIQLRSDVLPETNIHINATSKQLEVVFQTASVASNALLNTHLSTLQNHLTALSPGQFVTITTQLTSAGSSTSFNNQNDPSSDDLASFDQGKRRNSNDDNDTL